MNYYEIEFSVGDENTARWMCIKGIRKPTKKEASEFCRKEIEKFGLPVAGVYPIDECTARACYDFERENDWPVFS